VVSVRLPRGAFKGPAGPKGREGTGWGMSIRWVPVIEGKTPGLGHGWGWTRDGREAVDEKSKPVVGAASGQSSEEKLAGREFDMAPLGKRHPPRGCRAGGGKKHMERLVLCYCGKQQGA